MDRIDQTFFINLDSRADRLTHVKDELKKLPLKSVERFPGIVKTPGWIGCAESHIECLKKAKEGNYDSVFICEDDIVFLDPDVLQKQLKAFLDSDTAWDVIIIGGNVYRPFEKVGDFAVKVHNCQTTTGYIVAKHYVPTLLENFEEGHRLLMANQKNIHLRIDMYWKRLMKTDNWFAIVPLTVMQRPDVSDTEGFFMDTRASLLRLG